MLTGLRQCLGNMCVSNHHQLRLQQNAKPLINAGLNGFGERHDVSPGGGVLAPTPTNQHQRLLFVSPCVADGLAFPTASVNQPARRQLDAAIKPIIGHLKADHRMNRCYLKDSEGIRYMRCCVQRATTTVGCSG